MSYGFTEEEIRKIIKIYDEDVILCPEYVNKYSRRKIIQTKEFKTVLESLETVGEGRYLLLADAPFIPALKEGVRVDQSYSGIVFEEEGMEAKIATKLFDGLDLEELSYKKKFSFSSYSEKDVDLLRKVSGYGKNLEALLEEIKRNDFYLSYRPYDIITMSHGFFESCYGLKGCNVHSPWVLAQSSRIGIVYSTLKGSGPLAKKTSRFFFFDNGQGVFHLGRQYGNGASRTVFLDTLNKKGYRISNGVPLGSPDTSNLISLSLNIHAEWFYSPELTYYRDSKHRTTQSGILISKQTNDLSEEIYLMDATSNFLKEVRQNLEEESFDEYFYICPTCGKKIWTAEEFGDDENYKSLSCCLSRGWCRECEDFETNCNCDEYDWED